MFKSSLAAASLLVLGLAACEPFALPDTYTMTKWDDEGNAVGTEQVKEVKFNEGKITVSADILNRGKVAFTTMCSSCHGVKGDGKGPSARGLVPPPRNFTAPGQQLQFKFKSVPSGDLPTDEDLIRTVRGGLHGTAMLQWDVSETRLREIIQFIKTLSNRWQTEGPGTPIEISPDPVAAGKMTRDQAIEIGRKNYNLKTGPNCAACHPTYITQDEYNQYQKNDNKDPEPLRPNAAWSVPKISDAYGVVITPPDFTWHEMRSIGRVDPRASATEQDTQRTERRRDLYRAIATGIGGTAMPTWKGQISEDQIWGLVYYVEMLADYKNDSGKRAEFMARLRAGN
jgi:mono/diheme cytochrome c family protein